MQLVADYTGSDEDDVDTEATDNEGGWIRACDEAASTSSVHGADDAHAGFAQMTATTETMEVPQHKVSILTAATIARISRETGAALFVVHGKVRTGSVRKGTVATVHLTGRGGSVSDARAMVEDRLRANASFETEAGMKDDKTSYTFKRKSLYVDTGEKARLNPLYDWRHSGSGWDNGGLVGTDGAAGAHCTWKKS